MIFINWETGGAAAYIFFPSSWSEFEIRGSKNCEKYIQGRKMMDETAEVWHKSNSTYAKLKYNKYIGKIIGT